MRNLRLNGKAYPLTVESGWRGLSIDDCDGTACGGEVKGKTIFIFLQHRSEAFVFFSIQILKIDVIGLKTCQTNF